MTDKEIIEKNKIIAKYMGLKFRGEGLMYHKRWDWIMPVVIKMITENYSDIILSGDGLEKSPFLVCLCGDSKFSSSTSSKAGDEITAVWRAVYEAIESITL